MPMTGSKGNRVRFNVGGQKLETSATTLAIAPKDSYFGLLLHSHWNSCSASDDEKFIDRNPACFSILLDLLRTGELYIPETVPEDLLYKEADFYGLLDQVRAVKWGHFDGRNMLRLARTIDGRAVEKGTVIRASPDGGFCVAHGSEVHVYDWMLHAQTSIDLDHQVNDIGWAGLKSIIITAPDGMGLFDSSRGKLKRWFTVNSHGHLDRGFNAGPLCFSSDHRIFSTCRLRDNKNGIGVWDEETGKQVNFWCEPDKLLGEARRLHWLDQRNCLFAAIHSQNLIPYSLCLLDPRDKKVTWAWAGGPEPRCRERVWDAVPMEDKDLIALTDECYDSLGLLDLHFPPKMRWVPKLPTGVVLTGAGCHPKLEYYEGQLLLSTDDYISAFQGEDFIPKPMLHQSEGGFIRDFSVGGGRIFTLRRDKNKMDVWEPPRLAIL